MTNARYGCNPAERTSVRFYVLEYWVIFKIEAIARSPLIARQTPRRSNLLLKQGDCFSRSSSGRSNDLQLKVARYLFLTLRDHPPTFVQMGGAQLEPLTRTLMMGFLHFGEFCLGAIPFVRLKCVAMIYEKRLRNEIFREPPSSTNDARASMKARMVLRSLIAICLLFTPRWTYAQSFSWVKQIGTLGLNRGYSLKADNAGHFYVAGSFEGTAVFDSDTLTSKGDQDIFLAKYSDEGNLIWVKRAGGIGSDEGYSMRLDAKSENIVLTGFSQNGQFGDTTLSGTPFFLAKYDTSGTLKWARTIGTAGSGSETSVAMDTSGNIFVTGGSDGLLLVDTLVIYASYFVVKYDESGNVKWVRDIAPNHSSAGVQPSDINCDLSNNIYVTGFILGDTTRFDSTHFLVPQAGGNMFLVKYDARGTVDWAMKSNNTKFASSSHIAFDAHNNIYMTGNFTDSVNIGGISLAGNGTSSAFFAKFEPNGTTLWATASAGSGYSNGSDITLDKYGDMYGTGVSSHSTFFGNNLLIDGGLFVVKYTPDGQCLFAVSAGSNPGDIQTWGRDLAVPDSNGIYVTGYMGGSADFGSIHLTNNIGESIFITKLSPYTQSKVNQLSGEATTFSLFQNFPDPFNPTTTIRYQLPASAFVSLDIFDLLGRLVKRVVSERQNAGTHSVTFNGINLASGIYLYRLQAGRFNQTKKFILVK